MLRQELDDLQPQQVHRKRGAGGGLIFRIFWSSSLLSRHLAAWIMFPHVCWVRSPAELYGFLRLQCQWSQRNLIDAGESPWFKVVPPKRLCWWASPASSKKKNLFKPWWKPTSFNSVIPKTNDSIHSSVVNSLLFMVKPPFVVLKYLYSYTSV